MSDAKADQIREALYDGIMLANQAGESAAPFKLNMEAAAALLPALARIGDVDDLAYAGHRTSEPHDCFAMNCKGLGPEVERLRAQVVALDAEVARLEEILDGRDPEDDAPAYVPRPIRGEVGTIVGPPIMGTHDNVNSGPADPAS